MNAVLNGAAVNSRRFFDFDRPIVARQRDLAPKREINMVCKWSGGSAAIVWENNRAAGGGRRGNSEGISTASTPIFQSARNWYAVSGERERERVVREIENEEFSWSDT